MTTMRVKLAALGLLTAVGVTVGGLNLGSAKPAPTLAPVAPVPLVGEWRLKSVFKHHGQMVYDAAFAPDGKWFATAGADGTVLVWDTAGQTVWHKIEVVKNLPPPGPAVAPAFDPLKGPRAMPLDVALGKRPAGSPPPGLSLRFADDGQLRVGYASETGSPVW